MKTRMILIMLGAVALLAACKGKASKSLADSALAADSVLLADNGHKLIKTADISFKVKDVRQTGEAISLLADKFKGIVMHHHVQSFLKQSEQIHLTNDSLMIVSAFNTTGDMVIKIPAEKVEDFTNQVDHMGTYIATSKMDIEDKSLDYLATKLKENNREELVKQQKSGKVVIKRPAEILTLKDSMVDMQIASLRTDEQVAYSTISLNFYQNNTILKEIVANDSPSAYNIPVLQRIELAFASGWAIFMDIMVGLINLWVFIVAGIVIWIGIRHYRKRLRLPSTPSA